MKKKKTKNQNDFSFKTWNENKTRTNTKYTAQCVSRVRLRPVSQYIRSTYVENFLHLYPAKYKEPFWFEHIFHLAVSTIACFYFTIFIALCVLCASGPPSAKWNQRRTTKESKGKKNKNNNTSKKNLYDEKAVFAWTFNERISWIRYGFGSTQNISNKFNVWRYVALNIHAHFSSHQ